MKALVINSSPHMDKGSTAAVLTPFIKGMMGAGAEVEILYTKKLNINPCEGCLTCWLKTPGICIHQDDMVNILPKLTAEIIVLATPVYIDGMTGPMKMFLDRIIPGVLPFFEIRDGHNRHPSRVNTAVKGKVVLVSNCGFWEVDNFDPLVQHVKAWCKNANREFAGALLRPHGPSLGALLKAGLANDVIEAATEAGKQLVSEGKIADKTLKTVSRELMPAEIYLENINRGFQQALDTRTPRVSLKTETEN